MKAACLTAAFVLALVASTPAGANPLPAGARVRAGRTVDVPTFARAVARRYLVTFNAILAADFDRDGDVDVIAATDRGFVIWVNDGLGHLTSQKPAAHPFVTGSPGSTLWDDGGAEREEPVQNDIPSAAVLRPHAHGPPRLTPAAAADAASPSLHARTRSSSAPRAPPISAAK